MTRKQKLTSWRDWLTFPTPFSYEIDAPIETVVHQIAELDEDAALFRRGSQEISVLPMEDHYVFRLRRRRHGTLISSAEGQIRQDETGCVIVEGESRVNGWTVLVSLMMISLIGIGIALTTMPVVSRLIIAFPFAISVLFGMLTSFTMYRRDRQQMISTLHEALTDLSSRHAAKTKEKRYPALELDETDISYHEDDRHSQAQEKRR